MKWKSTNLIAVIFFLVAATVYLINEKYSTAVKQDLKDAFVTVVEVNDGDTVTVLLDKRREKVRLLGIDAPELGQRPWGDKAKEYLEAVVGASGWEVKLELDVEKRDQYNRILAYLRTKDGELVNLLMLKEGYAMLYTFPPNVKYAVELRSAQKAARDKGLGIWSTKGLKERPGDYRKEHPRI